MEYDVGLKFGCAWINEECKDEEIKGKRNFWMFCILKFDERKLLCINIYV